jgi:hypothetical protein
LPSIELSIVMSATTRRETNCTNYCDFFASIKRFDRLGSSSWFGTCMSEVYTSAKLQFHLKILDFWVRYS